MDDVVTEHAVGMRSGAMNVRNTEPEIERVYPLAEWIVDQQRIGSKLYTRKIIVVEDWTEVPRG